MTWSLKAMKCYWPTALGRAFDAYWAKMHEMRRVVVLIQRDQHHHLTIQTDVLKEKAFGRDEMDRIRDAVWPRIPGTNRPQKLLVVGAPDRWIEDWIDKKLKHLQETKHDRQRQERDADRRSAPRYHAEEDGRAALEAPTP